MTPASNNIYLIGPMGSGKTTIGRGLAIELGLEFYDCDRELEAQTGASVNLIFDVEGESGFRIRETSMLQELTSMKGAVVATGGGCILSQVNREMLSRSGTVVYLETTVTQQLARLRRDKSRPLLRDEDRKEKLRLMALKRNPLYESVADIRFVSSDRSINSSSARLAGQIREFWRERPGEYGGNDASTHAHN